MSAASQFIDPKVLSAMPQDLRIQVEKHFTVGVKQVDLRIAKERLLQVEREVNHLEKLHNVMIPRKLIP